MRKRRWSKRGNALAIIGVGVFLCVVMLGGILGQLTKMNEEKPEEVATAEDTIAEVESVDDSEETTSVDNTDTTTNAPEENTDGFKISVTCIEEDRTWLDVQNPNEVNFEYSFTVDGDEVELTDEDFKEEGDATAFNYDGVIKRYYAEYISEQGNHQTRAYNVVLSAKSSSFSQDYEVWSVRNFTFHQYDIKDDELAVIHTEYHEATPGNAASLYVEFSSRRPGRNCYLLRYEVDGKSYETWATSDYGSETYYAYLDHYTAPEDIDNPVVMVVKGEGEEVEVKIDGYEKGSDEPTEESDDEEEKTQA